jgi:polar amino acid transport system substrate-binding protein
MKNLAFYFSLIVLFLASGDASSSNKLRFVAEDLYPLHFIDENKQAQGFLVDLVTEVLYECQCQGYVEIMPQARAFKELRSDDNTLMMSLLKTPSREDEFHFLGSVFYARAYLIGLKSLKYDLKNLESAKDLRVSTVRGYYSQTFLQQAGFDTEQNLVLAPEPASLLQMLYRNRTDLVLTNTLHLDKELKSIGLDPTKIERKLSLRYFPHELHFVANKRLKSERAIRLKAALKKVKDSSVYSFLLSKWQLKLTK